MGSGNLAQSEHDQREPWWLLVKELEEPNLPARAEQTPGSRVSGQAVFRRK